ncbi:MAG: VanZ family protein [Hydrogenophaga sp.]|jgi:VanZ family protein|nr:VanZ family protein [Hydrogenophaga sp.]
MAMPLFSTQTLLRLAFWLSLAAITVASLVPVVMLPPQALDLWDKAQHALGFGWLALLGLWAYPRHVLAVVVGLLVWGAAIEVMQSATGWRYGDVIDWIADAVGVLAAWAVWRLVPARLARRT